MAALRIEMRTGFASIDARFEQVDARFAQVDARFEQVDARLEQVDARLDQIDTRLDSLDDNVASLGGRVDLVDGKIEEYGKALIERIDGVSRRALLMHEDLLSRLVVLTNRSEAPPARPRGKRRP
jgi:chromosome segregation ATPase